MANLATTAAGVVAGSFLYQGIQNLMGHHNPGSGLNEKSAAADPQPASANDSLTDNEIAGALDDDVTDDPGGMDGGGSDLA